MTTETNSGRLKRISKTDRYMYDRSGKHVTVSSEDFGWLIQQAEKANTLEYFGQKTGKLNVFLQGKVSGRLGHNVVDIAMDLIVEQEKENARLREALKFYADKETYEITGEKFYVGHGDFTEESYRPIERDIGCIARHSLKGESE